MTGSPQTDPCTCPWTDPSTWTYYCGATEPGSQREFDPECPQHGLKRVPLTWAELLDHCSRLHTTRTRPLLPLAGYMDDGKVTRDDR